MVPILERLPATAIVRLSEPGLIVLFLTKAFSGEGTNVFSSVSLEVDGLIVSPSSIFSRSRFRTPGDVERRKFVTPAFRQAVTRSDLG